MVEPTHILIVSQDLTIQNIVEQVGRVRGFSPVSAQSLSDAQAILAQRGPPPFALAVIDTRVSGGSEAETLDELPGLLQEWAPPRLTIPCLYLGSVSQKYAALAAQTALVPFLMIPFSASEFGETMEGLVGSEGILRPAVKGQVSRQSALSDDTAHQWLSPPVVPDVHCCKPSQGEQP